MFRSADEMLLEEREKDFPLHVMDFRWDGFEPRLEYLDMPAGRMSEADLRDVRFWVSRRKRCVGYFDGDGLHNPCPYSAEVTRFRQCPSCAREVFIPDQECIFDPKCDGDSEACAHPFCRREHVLYLAFYDTYAKIGMSSSARVDRRLIEQGADAFSVFGSFPSRKKAREMEIAISDGLRIPQMFRQDVLLRNFSRRVDAAGIEERHRGLKDSLASMYGLSAGDLVWLDRYPIDLPLRAPPVLQPTHGRHRGASIGVKGRWLVYEKAGIRALNLADLPSRYMSLL
jgi:hypothetical protein